MANVRLIDQKFGVAIPEKSGIGELTDQIGGTFGATGRSTRVLRLANV